MKRTFDLVVSLTTLVLLAPLLAAIAVLIWIDSGRPILFRQWRIGRGLVPFQIYKFRTMRVGADRDGALTAAGDPRVTRLGVWLRLTKLDELPQLINVLKGEMSLVGPRPEVEKYVRLFADEYREILRVRPGVTDLASLKYRHEGEILATAVDREEAYVSRILPDKLRLAKAYVSRASFWYDLTLIGRTLWSLPPLPDFRPPAAGFSTFGESRMGILLLRYRRALVVGVHLALIVITNYCAFWLRFDGSIPAESFALFVQFLPALVLVRGLTFVPFRLYEGLWRYTGIWDLRNIVGGVLTSSTIFFILVYVALGNAKYPRSIYLIDAMLLITSMGGVRLARRLYAELVRSPRERRVLVYGAGDAGEMVVRDMLRHPSSDYEPIGFIDDDLSKVGRRIHGVPVLGSRRDLTRIIATKRPSEILVALPGVSRASVRSVVSALESFKIPITTVPNLSDILNGRVTVQQIRHLQIEDLLERTPVGLDVEPLKALVGGRSVLVTGAGGSIGSELCRQIAALQPSLLLMFERYENSLYAIANAINDHHPQVSAVPLVGDVTDADRVGAVFGAYRPSLVFHAAAHKHVPLMELNPCEAVKNNVLGTRVVAEAAVTHGVERLVLISSDKAVNPSSVMGATKRVAELISRELNDERVTRCITVRFGNVLGSNGSVVPRFLEQIKAGGPVTVTHREMRRYFMLIPEAVQLVLHAAAIDESGGTYVLEMGDQIKLVDLARNLIRLSGHVPDEEIPITFTGLRPGEKLAEELVCDDEMVRPSRVPNILQVTPNLQASRQTVAGFVMRLERLAFEGNEIELVEELARLVPSFRPDPSVRRLRPIGDRQGSTAASGGAARPHVERRNALGADRRQARRGGRRREDSLEPVVEQTASTERPVTVQP